MRRIDEIIIHCSATPEGKDYTVEDITRWHKEKGFDTIGYHYVIYRDGSIHNGRPEGLQGAHCYRHNQHSIGICYIGGLDKNRKPKDTRTKEQKKALEKLVTGLMKDYPGAMVYGHRAFAKKDCPCFDVYEWMKDIGYEDRAGAEC